MLELSTPISNSIVDCSKEDADNAFSRALGNVQVNNEGDILDIIEHELPLGSESKIIQSLVKWTDSFNASLLWYAARNGYATLVPLLLNFGCDFKKARKIKGSGHNLGDASKSFSTPLMAAISYSNYKAAIVLLEHYHELGLSLSPEQAGAALLTLASSGDDLDDIDSLPSNVADFLIKLVGAGINRDIKFEYVGEKMPLLSHAAMRVDCANLVHKLLQQECVLNCSNALFKAASVGNVNIVRLFISSQKQISPLDLSFAAILACKSETQSAITILEILLAHDASLRHKTTFGETVVSNATSKSDVELLKYILEHGGDPMEGFEFILNDESSAESHACLSVLLEHLRKQSKIEDPAWINSKKDGMPVLTLISMRCSGAFVETVLEHGADVDLVDDEKSHTPLHWACNKDNVSAAQALLKAGADPNAHNDTDQFTCLHTAVACGSKELVELLLINGANSNMKTKLQGFTALHVAVDRGCIDIVNVLLKMGNVDIDQVDNDGTTSLSDAVVKACSERHHELIEIVQLLLDAKASPNVKDLRGNTALISAVGGRNIQLVSMLVDAEADLEAMNEDCNSPLSLVAESLDDGTSMKILKVMLDHEVLRQDNNKLHVFLRNKTRQLLKEGKAQVIAALAVLMLQSVDTRKVITDSPGLWKSSNIAPRRHIKYIRDDSDYPNEQSRPENMLTWAIMNDSPAVQILLESEDEDVVLPFNWRSSLIAEETKIGTPLRCAVDKRSVSAISTMLNVVVSMWDYKYSSNSKQRNEHPLDNLHYQDLAYVMITYPSLMASFLKDVRLVPTYSFVSGLIQAPISRYDTWVLLSNERSPTAFWDEYINTVNQISDLHDDDDDEIGSNSFKQELSTFDRFRRMKSLIWRSLRPPIPEKDKRMLKRKYSMKVIEEQIHSWPSSLMDRILLLSKAFFSKDDVQSYVVPIKGIASFGMLLTCVNASKELRNPMLFDSPIIAAVVELHWRLYGLRNHIFNLVLFLSLLVVFITLSYKFDEWVQTGGALEVFGWFLQAIKLAISLYFLCWQEYKQMMHENEENNLLAYFLSVWNLIDLSMYGLIFAGFFMSLSDSSSPSVDGIHSIAVLLLWFKLLDFIRPFRRFGPMVNMIFEVSTDIRGFLVVLLIVMIGFGNSFSIVLEDSDSTYECTEEDPFQQEVCIETYGHVSAFKSTLTTLRSSFAYMLGAFDFGDLDDGPFPVLLTIIWAFFMFIVNIILFNLLIAIISESFARISSTKIPSWRLEQASVVAGIFSTLSVKDQQLVHDYIRYNPWLQVLVPKGSLYISSDENESLKPAEESKFEAIQNALENIAKSGDDQEWQQSTSDRLKSIEKALAELRLLS